MFDDNNEDEYINDRYSITSPTKFAKYIGKTVAKESGFEMKEFKKLISVPQIKGYIKEVGKREGKTYSVSHDEIDELCLLIHEHTIGFDLTKAAAEGMLDCYWDEEQNTMMFRTNPPKALTDETEDD